MVRRRVTDSILPRLLALLLLAAAAMPSVGVMSAAAAPAAIPIGDADGDGDIDLDDLFKRLGDSKAVGVLTKISLKREIDELERDLKAFHDGTVKSTLDKIHERYDLLVHKLMSLLQSKDPGLARDIARSRDLLWSKLADPSEFKRL
jgi:hypothetical protein